MKKIKKMLLTVLAVILAFMINEVRTRLAVPEPDVEPTFTVEPANGPEASATPDITENPQPDAGGVTVEEDGEYETKDEVALYLWTYHRLPSNYMTKNEARKHGWENGPLYKVVPGKSIGGDVYGNYEGVLPKIKGKYRECDIETLGRKNRGAKRIVYDEQFNIYYTEDHYESFELLYGE